MEDIIEVPIITFQAICRGWIERTKEEEEEYNQNSDVCSECRFQKLNEHMLPQCGRCDEYRCEECPCDCYENWKDEAVVVESDTHAKLTSWSKLTVKLLKIVCKERGLKKYSKLKKEELLRMLYLDEFIDPVETTN